MTRWIGSQAQPEPARFRARVEQLLQDTQTQLADADRKLVEAHNAYSLYTALLLIHVTGHRPVTDPFCYREALGDGIAIVEDKAATESQSLRLLVVPPTAQEQLRYYFAHLESLAERLADQSTSRPVAAAIDHMLHHVEPDPPVPLLFFLTPDWRTLSLSPATITDRLTDWPWPLNLGRHLIATGLRGQIPAPLISLQLGHAVPDEEFFTADSFWSPRLVQALLAPALEDLLRLHSWRAIAGLQPHSENHATGKRVSAEIMHRHGTLGPELRRQTRWAERARDRFIVREIIREELPPGHTLDQTSLDRIGERLADWSEGKPERHASRLRLLWRWARRVRGHAALKLPQLMPTLEPAKPPFWRGFPRDAHAADDLRHRFAAYLASAARSAAPPSTAERAAEIVISAALFGALVDAKRLEALGGFLPRAVHALGSQVVIEEHSSTVARCIWRWMADDLTAALIGGSNLQTAVLKHNVLRALSHLLKVLDASLDVRHPVQVLSRLAQAYWLNQLPGWVYAHLSGELAWQPLTASTLARLLCKVRLRTKGSTIEEASMPSEVAPTFTVGGRGSRVNGVAFYRAIRKIFTEVWNTPAQGTKRHNRELNQQLTKRLNTLLLKDSDSPAAARILAMWALHLATCGTPRKHSPAFNTIRRYVTTLGLGLIELASELDLLNLSDLEFETLYTRLLAYPDSERERNYLAKRLRVFHAFLIDTWVVEEPEWSFLPARARHELGIDSNIITPHEYRRALTLLLEDPAVDARTRTCQAALLILGYRFGLRAGEALRLLDRNLILDRAKRIVTVEVASNIYGNLKSPAGARVVPLIESFSETERDVLELAKSAFATRLREEDPVAGLFANPVDPRAPIERGLFFKRIHLALRLVSGDPTQHFQLLRHSFACRLLGTVLGDLVSSPGWNALRHALGDDALDPPETRRFLFGDETLNNESLRGLARLLGHADVRTTLQHYVHVQDFLIQGLANRALPSLPDSAWSYALGEKRETVGKRLQRHPDQTPPAGPRWPYPISSEPPSVARGRPPATLPGEEVPARPLTLETVDRILLATSERHGHFEGLAAQLFLPERSISQVICAAQDLEDRTGYRGLSVIPPLDHWPPVVPDKPRARIHAETVRGRLILRALQNRIDRLSNAQHQLLIEGLRDWDGALRAGNSNEYIFGRRSQLDRFIQAVTLLGTGPGAFVADVGPAAAMQDDNLVSKIQAYGFSTVRSTARLAGGVVRIRLKKGVRSFIYTSTFTRVFFVSHVLLTMRNLSEAKRMLASTDHLDDC